MGDGKNKVDMSQLFGAIGGAATGAAQALAGPQQPAPAAAPPPSIPVVPIVIGIALPANARAVSVPGSGA